MNGTDRVRAVIARERPDRIPLYAWLRANLAEELTAEFGSVEAFEDAYDFDLSHVFSGMLPYDDEVVKSARADKGGPIEPGDLLDLPLTDPDEDALYDRVREAVRHHKHERGRFLYVQTPGVFEMHNRYFGIENHLAYLLLFEDELHLAYRRLTDWVLSYADRCIDLGIDMIHVSDDWGAQKAMLFAPDTWRRLIFPYHRLVTEHVHARGAYVSLHSDGNINQALDGIVELGYDVVHPYQESAGMSYDRYLEGYQDSFTVMGGIDIQRDLGFGEPDRAIGVIDRVLETMGDRGMILCTTHFVQHHCSIEELVAVFDHIKTRPA